jgi:malonyl-CoA reductase/3-hydroxypropionate dehydrogenase (NADP+)
LAKAKTLETSTNGGRLAGKIALVTGAAGNLGGHIVRHYLAEGATVVMTGRTAARIEAAADAIRAETGADPARVATVVLDGADAGSVRDGVAEVVSRFGTHRHPRQQRRLGRTEAADRAAAARRRGTRRAAEARLERQRDRRRRTAQHLRRRLEPRARGGAGDGRGRIDHQRLDDLLAHTLLWARGVCRAKAAMNAWSRELSLELGTRGIRVNLVFPGPSRASASDRCSRRWTRCAGDDAGTTANQFFDMMSLERATGGNAKAKTFPTPADIATTCVVPRQRRIRRLQRP